MASLLSLINQLITEHGSVEIQEKRIAQIKELATLLEKKLAFCESETSILKAENKALKAENVVFQKEIVELKEKLQPMKQIPHDFTPSNSQMRILKLLALKESMKEDSIIEIIEQKRQSTLYDIEELRISGLVDCERYSDFNFISLTHEGRKYLKKIGVI